MKVCVYVCPAACRRTHTSHHPKIWRGLLISPGLGTEPGGDPKCWPPGVPPTVTPSEKPWRVKNWKGASKQKLLLGVGLPDKIYFWGAHTKHGAAGSTPPKEVFALRILRGPANKSCSLRWVCSVKFYLWGAHPNPGGSTLPNEGICFENFEWASKQKLLLGVGLHGKILFVGGSPLPLACRVHSTK